MKRIIIIEDSKDRISQFKKNFTNAELTIVESVKEAIKVLKKNKKFNYGFFDHDLGKGGDSIDIVNWLLKNKSKIPTQVYIHSANPVGAKNIMNKLDDSRRASMIWKKEIRF